MLTISDVNQIVQNKFVYQICIFTVIFVNLDVQVWEGDIFKRGSVADLGGAIGAMAPPGHDFALHANPNSDHQILHYLT